MDNLFDDEMTEIEEENEFIEKDFEYSNLNIVELNDFLKRDTNNYKDLAGSLCGKIYLLETKLMPEDKSTIQVIENQISYEHSTYEKRVADLEQQQVPENAGFFAKMSFKKQIDKNLKSLKKDHEKTLDVLENRLKKHEKQQAENKEDYLKLTNKLKDKGFFWEEMRKLVEEKIKLGILSFDKSNAEKNKPRVKKIDPREYEELYPQKPKKKPKTESGGSSSSGKDIDFYGDPNYFDISKLSPMEQIEFRKLLGRYNHNRDLFREYEEAKRIRMSMFAMDRMREFEFLRLRTSDYALHRAFGSLFGPDRDPCLWCGLCDMFGLPHDTFGFHGHLPKHGRPFNYHGMCEGMAKQILSDSGYGLSGREKHLRQTTSELSKLLKKEFMIGAMCGCFDGNKGHGKHGKHQNGHIHGFEGRDEHHLDRHHHSLEEGYQKELGDLSSHGDIQGQDFGHFQGGMDIDEFDTNAMYEEGFRQLRSDVTQASMQSELELQQEKELSLQVEPPDFSDKKNK